MAAGNIVLLAYYFPPINSSGAKRMEAMSKYFAAAGRNVTVITTTKSGRDEIFSEEIPPGITLIELDWLGRIRKSVVSPNDEAVATGAGGRTPMRRFKDLVMRAFGQLPDPRLPFAFGMLSPLLAQQAKVAFRKADAIVATTPPWSMLLAGTFARWRFGGRLVLDYRDQFSYCHEMPGTRVAKAVEFVVDRSLARRADMLVSISQPMAEYYKRFNSRSEVVLNGYDPARVDQALAHDSWTPRKGNSPLTLRYLGIITAGRIPRNLLGALRMLVKSGRIVPGSVVFEFYGEGGQLEALVRDRYPDLLPLFRFLPRVPYKESLRLAVTADYLLFCENAIAPLPGQEASASGVLTTKLFEYLASGRPIVAEISPDALAGKLILQCGGCHFVANKQQDFEALLMSDGFWDPPASIHEGSVRGLSRAAQAQQYLKLLDSIAA